MTSSMSGLQNSLQASYGGQITPFRSSYDNMSGSDLMALAHAQSSYHPQAPEANAQAAEGYIRAAGEATDPRLVDQLLQKALDMITPGGSHHSGGSQDLGGPISTEIGGPSDSDNCCCGTDDYGAGSSGRDGSRGPGLTVSGDTIDTGRYTIAGSKNDDGSLTVTDKQTGKSFEVWGDPHIKVDGKDTADFQKDNVNIQLQDGTVIHMQPGAVENGVAHLDQVSVTKGDQSVTIGGQGGSFANGVMTSQVMDGTGSLQSDMYNAPGTDNITYGADDMLHYDNADGSMGRIITGKNGGGETDLDGVGGGLIGHPANSGSDTGGTSGDRQSLISQLQSALSQYVGGYEKYVMQAMLSNMENQSGFLQADPQAA